MSLTNDSNSTDSKMTIEKMTIEQMEGTSLKTVDGNDITNLH